MILPTIRLLGKHKGDLTVEDHEELIKEWNRMPSVDFGPTKIGKNTQIKKGTAAGINFDSKWEYAFYLYMTKVIGVPIQRNSDVKLKYTDVDGSIRTWIPDFTGQQIYEVKGRETATDRCKRDQYPNVKWYGAEEMKPILREVRKRYPNWESDYVERF